MSRRRARYDRRSRIRRDFLDQPEQLARRFRWAGVFNLLLVGPTLLFVVIYYIMRHAEEFRSAPLATAASARQWTKCAAPRNTTRCLLQ